MKHIFLSLLVILPFLPGCTSHEVEQNHKLPSAEEVKKNQAEIVVDLNESAQIIVELLKKNNISSILTPEALQSEDTIDTLLKNFSPAQMAFEAEVLNFIDPVILLYYDASQPEHNGIMNEFLATALNHQQRAKFVLIEVNKLFSLADQAHITTAPTILLIHNRSEIGRIVDQHSSIFEIEIIKLLEKITASA